METERTPIEMVRSRTIMFVGPTVMQGDLSVFLYQCLEVLATKDSEEDLKVEINVNEDLRVVLKTNCKLFVKGDFNQMILDGNYKQPLMMLHMAAGMSHSFQFANSKGVWDMEFGKIVAISEEQKYNDIAVFRFGIDKQIIPDPYLDIDWLAHKMKELAGFFSGHVYKLSYEGRDRNYQNTFQSPNGLLDTFKHFLGYRMPVHFVYQGKLWSNDRNVFSTVIQTRVKDEDNGITLDVLIGPFASPDNLTLYYVNCQLTPQGGSHVDVLHQYLTDIQKETFSKRLQGFTCLVSLQVGDKHFYVNNTRDRVESPILDSLMGKAIDQLNIA